jgi:hypothetical protein
VGGQHHALAALPPGKNWYLLYRGLVGPQGRSGHVQKISLPTGFNPRIVHPVASHYTDLATRPTVTSVAFINYVESHKTDSKTAVDSHVNADGSSSIVGFCCLVVTKIGICV